MTGYNVNLSGKKINLSKEKINYPAGKTILLIGLKLIFYLFKFCICLCNFPCKFLLEFYKLSKQFCIRLGKDLDCKYCGIFCTVNSHCCNRNSGRHLKN